MGQYANVNSRRMYQFLKWLGNHKDISYKKDAANLYFSEYLKKVMAIPGLSLRAKDKYLWGKSFYNDLEKLLA